MTLTSYERKNTFKSTHTFTSGSANVDPSGNLAYITVYDPNGVVFIQASGERVATGQYQYYISTSSDSLLGIYRIDWNGSFWTDDLYGYMPKHEVECILLDLVT